jgi:hypothetical protein
MTHLVERLREVFKERRYGAGAEYHPDFDLFDVAADEIERLRTALEEIRMTFEEIDARAKQLFESANPGIEWAYIDEGDRNYWRKAAQQEVAKDK